ncbi:MAG: riboflavin kinase [Thermoproteota archaeon]|nr:MAG: riboflavin kinase [Candidatus Korarchaeota archaeon]RLG53916.1 MAG: riboflavin kinase [Candidatus Korarchaeota archaeon]
MVGACLLSYSDLPPRLLYALIKLSESGISSYLTPRDVASKVGIPRQTAYRWISELSQHGLIELRRERGELRLKLSRQAVAILEELYSTLSKALLDMSIPAVLHGNVVSGLGEGRYYMSLPRYLSSFKEKLGYTPYPGTLNIRLHERDLPKLIAIERLLSPIVIPGFTHEGRRYGAVYCYLASLNRSERVHIVKPERTHHPRGIVEVISPKNLRAALSLKDGDQVTLVVPPIT